MPLRRFTIPVNFHAEILAAMKLDIHPGSTPVLDQHRQAVRRNPRDANAHALLGLALLRAGQHEEGVSSVQRALELNPKIRGLHAVLAAALAALGRDEEAVLAYGTALRFGDQEHDLHQGLSDCLLRLGRASEAEKAARRAVELAPDNVACLLSLGGALYSLKQADEALPLFERVLQLEPARLSARHDLGVMLAYLGRHEEAIECFQAVLAVEPAHANALLQLGRSYRSQKRYDDAVGTFTRLHELAPDRVDVLVELGNALRLKGDMSAGVALLQRALELAPEDIDLMYNLLGACFNMGDWELAMQLGRRIMEVNPSAPANSVMLFVLSHCCMDADELTREHFAFGERWETPLRALRRPHDNDRDPQRRLRIGMVSGDLYHHALTNFVGPVFDALKDSPGVALYAYYNNVIEDSMTEQLRGYTTGWRMIAGLDDDVVENMIREDGIDILIDLSGHSALNRLSLFARKPAPVQATWAGYAGTTGLEAMDYILYDQFMVPEGRYESQFTEHIVRLPLGAPFLSATNAPPVSSLPALRNGYITFGSFHRTNKLNREVIAQWSKLLHAVPTAKMLLGGRVSGQDDVVLDWFADNGIDRERLVLRERTHIYGYLEQHQEVDVCLAPFPYSGSTTIGHALWMGVPTLATIGPTNPSQAVVPLMAHLGLADFIADSETAYVALGVFLSQNFDALAAMRASMRKRFAESMLGYPGITAAALEHAWRLMWQRWCAGEAAAPLRVRLSDLSLGN